MKIIPTIFHLLAFQLTQTHSFSATPATPVVTSPETTTNNDNIKYKTPIVICPGFGNDSIDYDTPLNQPPSKGLQTILSNQGFDKSNIYITPVKRIDWIRVGGGLFDIPDFYTNTAKPTGLGYGWYIQRLKECVDLAYEESGGQKVILIGHSAGGWLARAAMGDGVWSTSTSTSTETETSTDIRTNEKVSCLVTVGAIHKTPSDGSDGTTCVTRGALKFVEENYPGAFLKEEGIKYISIGGKAIVGDKNDAVVDSSDADTDADIESNADQVYAVRGEGSAKKVAFTSYEAVCGDGNVVGDGVVPLEWSMLEGARQIQLDDVLHSINEAGTTIPTDRWYGSEKVVNRWLPDVLDEINLVDKNSRKNNADENVFDGLQQWATNLFK